MWMCLHWSFQSGFSKCVMMGWLQKLVSCFNFSRSVYKQLVWLSFRTKRAKYCCVNERQATSINTSVENKKWLWIESVSQFASYWMGLVNIGEKKNETNRTVWRYVYFVYVIHIFNPISDEYRLVVVYAAEYTTLLLWFLVICSTKNVSTYWTTGVVYYADPS